MLSNNLETAQNIIDALKLLDHTINSYENE